MITNVGSLFARIGLVVVLCFLETVFGQIHWTQRNPFPTGKDLYSVTWTGSLYVAVGDTILTSPDGFTWTNRIKPTSNSLKSVLWKRSPDNNDKGSLIAVGDTGTILISPDGISWNAANFSSWKCIRSVAWANPSGAQGSGIFVAVGEAFTNNPLEPPGAVITSSNGFTWTLNTDNPSTTWEKFYSIIWSGPIEGTKLGKFLAIGYAVYESNDGATWTNIKTDIYGTYRGIACSGSALQAGICRYVAVADSFIVTSIDGVTWEKKHIDSVKILCGVIWADALTGGSAGQFVVAGHNGIILTSPDGVTWTRRESGITDTINSVFWRAPSGDSVSGQYVAVGSDGIILASPDGIAWEKITQGTVPDLTCVTSGNLSLESDSGQLVAVGNKGTILSSTDGITWNERNSGTTAYLCGVTCAKFKALQGNGLFVAVGWNGMVTTSGDGVTWTSKNSGEGNALFSVSHTDSLIVAVGYAGKSDASGTYSYPYVLRSSDGIIWQGKEGEESKATIYRYKNLIWTGSLLCVVGEGMSLSRDGSQWSGWWGGSEHNCTGVAYGDSQYVVCKQDGNLLIGNESKYKSIKSGTSNALYSIVWTGRQFVTVGAQGTILSSLDGNVWTKRNSGSLKVLFSVAWTGHQLVAVGQKGLILTSPEEIDSITPASCPGKQPGVPFARITARYANKNLLVRLHGFDRGKKALVRVFDILGKLRIAASSPSNDEILICAGVLAPGRYIVQAECEKTKVVCTVIVSGIQFDR